MAALLSRAVALPALSSRSATRQAALPAVRCAPGSKLTRKLSVAVSARAGGSSYRSSGPDIVDRVLSTLPYLVPFFDAVQYGRYLFYMYPWIRQALQPVLPVMSLYHSLPFGSFLTFFGLFLLVVNNKAVSRFTRFHTMQALLVDVALVLPRLVETVFTPPTTGWGAKLYLQSQSFIWIFTTLLCAFGIGSAILGMWGRIPFIADAADSQLMR